MLLGCALFHGVLSPAAALCKALQNDELCIVSAVSQDESYTLGFLSKLYELWKNLTFVYNLAC